MPNEKKIDSIRKSKRPFKLLDIIVFVLIISLSVVILVLSFKSEANYVEIRYEGKMQRYSLKTNAEIVLKEHYVVVIKDGLCYVEETDCSNRTCKYTGAIKRAGQIIVCIPYGIVIKIIGDTGNELP